MITVEHQDSEILILYPYTWLGEYDGIYLKAPFLYLWAGSIEGNDYRVMINRTNGELIQISNPFYQDRYQAIEPQLTGDVLILGMGLAELDPFLVTGSSWVWVERNQYLVDNIVPTNGVVLQCDAEDIEYIAANSPTPTFDTILIDFKQSQLNDYASLLSLGGTIIEMVL